MPPLRRVYGLSPALATIAMAVALTAAPRVLVAASRVDSVRKPLSAFEAAATERAKAGAARRLRSPECQKLLTAYSDRAGRTLSENLAPWGMSAAEYVRQLPLYDGAGVAACRRGSVRLATFPGEPPVFVCTRRPRRLNSAFSTVEAENPSLAEVMVIHEMLHTLGLGENPPTTFEITEQVKARCR